MKKKYRIIAIEDKFYVQKRYKWSWTWKTVGYFFDEVKAIEFIKNKCLEYKVIMETDYV